ncbi:DUF3320 domain-containing protein [Mucilaginibacter sp. McL0603]|uniref:DUF3320 domain-containing protein n=1 Tax=Mucilaginibacter sp. McL0603 TaxID=3415670 RepID=UPI003CF46F61
MQESIQAKLEASRKELLDLGLRNPLLNYKSPKGKGLTIIREKSEAIYDILVRQGKAMTFLANKDTVENFTDTRLQTGEEEEKLQSRLLNTYYFARTSIEEQGVNILYLALGMLRWNDGEEDRLAPILLVPVNLERSSAQERFRLRYTGSEIGANLSLQAKMKTDFNINIPDIPEAEVFDMPAYFKELGSHISSNWSVEADAIELGFFSFGKFLIYNDLETSNWPKDHPNLVSLFETGFHEDVMAEEDDLDADTKANELLRVVDADSSQVMAMLAVNDGGNLVIQGPPGTGKSQTITNIIANAIGQGKKVLFVAEKMAALEVVKRRLDNIQLGEACLELHSHKSNKKDLHAELKRVLELGKPAFAQLQLEMQLLAPYRDELNAYCNAVNSVIAGSGRSAQQVIGFLLKIDKATQNRRLVKLVIEDIKEWNAEKMKLAEEMADRIQARLKDIGRPADLSFWGSKLLILLPHEREAILQQLGAAYDSTVDLQTHINFIEAQTGFKESLTGRLSKASQAPDLSELNVKDPAWQSKANDIKELLDAGQELEELYRNYKDIFIDEAWTQDILEIRRNIVTYGDKWYRGTIGGYRKSKQQLASFLKITLPADAAGKLRLIDTISEARRLEKILSQSDLFASGLFGKRWLKQRSNWNALAQAVAYLSTINDPILLNYLDKHENPSVAGKLLDELNQKSKDAGLQTDLGLKALLIETNGGSLEQQISRWKNWIDTFPELQRVIDWNNLAAQTENAGLAFLIKAAEDWDEAAELLKVSLQKTWYECLIEQAFALNPALSRFERASHEEVVEKFKKLDQLNLHYNRARVALKHWEGLPRLNAGGQVNILKTEFNKKGRHMPIRKLVEEAGKAMQAIKPVWMMSPMSIANFMPPGVIDFDIVIFDEASQVRPVDAIGAIARGKQLVVVGDTRQLPPTSFFDKLNTEIEDEENVTADMQSILGMCDGQGAPNRMLKWHYRSRHESLISLSNHEFYEDKLVIFPSPGSRQSLGLRFHHLPEAIYDRGKTRTNPLEAEAVAKAVIEHATKNPGLTLGVVAFSSAQMQAIQVALETQRRINPATETFFNGHSHEPFFIKNLENVQGDERDVIMISIGYGRVVDGKVPMSFGPLNNEGGERRLNVLITRAKMRCEVFTNITSEDIKVTEASRFGIRALKSFLYFAQFSRFEKPDALIPDAIRPFEEEVTAQLTAKGYIVRNKIGSAGFYLDLTVVDPENPGRYIIGIECDGQAYASARSATDRDRLRTQILELFGWNIYRLWSTDWYRNPERELQKLVAAIEYAKTITETSDRETELYQKEITRLELQPISIQNAEYQLADIHIDGTNPELHLYTFHQIGEWITEIVKVEGPIHFDEMVKRIVEAAGFSKAGSRITYTLTQALHATEQAGHVKLMGEFLWDPEMQMPVVRDRSRLPAAYRKLSLIAPEEIYEAIRQLVTGSISITEEEAVPLVAKQFGFVRVTEEMKQALSDAVGQAIRLGIITNEGINLKAKHG